MHDTDKQLTSVLQKVAEVRDLNLQREIFNRVLDLQGAWRAFAEGLIQKHHAALDDAQAGLCDVGQEMRINPLGGQLLEQTNPTT